MMAASMTGLMMSVSAMAVLSSLCAPGYAAGTVSMAAHIRAPGQAAGMIPVTVVCGVRITIHPVVHMGSRFGTVRNIASVVAVISGQHTAVDSAEAMPVFFRLCTSRNRAGNACLIFLCRALDFYGTSINRI